MIGSGETSCRMLEPKGNAKTLRQKDRAMTILCRVGQPTPKVQPDHAGNLSGNFSRGVKC